MFKQGIRTVHNWWRRSGQQVSIQPKGKTEEEKERGAS